MKISQKLPLFIVGAGLAAGVTVGVATYVMASDSLKLEAEAKLAVALEGHKATLSANLSSISQDLTVIASSLPTRWAIGGLVEGWKEIETDPTEELRRLYVETNPHPASARQNYDEADDDSTYSELHALYHPWFRTILEEGDYADILLLDPEGNLIYSVVKSKAFATNVLTGPWRSSDLAAAFRAAHSSGKRNYQAFFDFQRVAANDGKPASFIASPVLGDDGQILGVLAFQISIHRVDHVLQDATGLGETGETFLVGNDFLMRSDSRFSEEPTILVRRIETPAVKAALAGEHGAMDAYDAERNWVVYAYAPLDFGGVRWALLAQISHDEIMAPVTELGIHTAMIGGPVLLALFILGWFLARSITRPLKFTVGAVARLAKGEKVELDVERGDEIGDLSRSLSTIYLKGLEATRLRSALESSQTQLMLLNRAHELVYVTPSLMTLLDRLAPDIRKDLPQFDPQNPLEICLKPWLDRVTGQAGLLANLQQSCESTFEAAGATIDLHLSPVLGSDKQRLGAVIEWNDRTAQLAAQIEMDALLAAANQGDFSRRISANESDGTMARLAAGMNQLTTLVEQAMDDLGEMLAALAQGDLSHRITRRYQGKFESLAQHGNDTSQRLTEIVAEIKKGTNDIAHVVTQIDDGTQNLAGRTDEAASKLESTATAMEQMAATVTQNAENSHKANELARQADEVAGRGGATVEQTVAAMSQIADSFKQIADIIGVIDEISFQTNLLALNASVEAARAGEAGKGFAVVASEVRGLALRTSQAAGDIKKLVKSSDGQVQNGVNMVNEAGGTLKEVMQAIGQVAAIIDGIAHASGEQATGVADINSAVGQMDTMTQQNTALVAETAASTRTLAAHAERLGQMMAFFSSGKEPSAKSSLGEPDPTQNAA